MFLPFFAALRAQGVPASLREYLAFLDGVQAGLVTYDIDAFYYLARAALVKDERHLDRFDRAFAASFKGLDALTQDDVVAALDLPREWLDKLAEEALTPEERAVVQGPGGFERLMELLRQRLAEQTARHQGGSKWIGTAGTSPFGAYGYNPEGVRIGQDRARHRRATKVWDARAFRDLDDRAELAPRNLKLALKGLRKWARDGAAQELDLDGTIRASADAGWLDVRTRPERRNAVKVLLLFDVGGSMDDHVDTVQALFAAARTEFRHMEHYYFHNCLYEYVWRDNARRGQDRVPTQDLLRRFGSDWKCIFVGDAAMSPYEIAVPGGANEHWNAESGQVWLQRACAQWPDHLWINPAPQDRWRYTQSTAMIRDIVDDRMVPMTPDGISRGIKLLG